MKAHLPLHEKVKKKLPCAECGKNFSKAFNLKVHYSTQHPQKALTCVPDLVSETPDEGHFNAAIHECEICRKVFRRKENVKNHILVVHVGTKKFRCEPCETAGKGKKTFKRSSDLYRHIKKYHTFSKDEPTAVSSITKKLNIQDLANQLTPIATSVRKSTTQTSTSTVAIHLLESSDNDHRGADDMDCLMDRIPKQVVTPQHINPTNSPKKCGGNEKPSSKKQKKKLDDSGCSSGLGNGRVLKASQQKLQSFNSNNIQLPTKVLRKSTQSKSVNVTTNRNSNAESYEMCSQNFTNVYLDPVPQIQSPDLPQRSCTPDYKYGDNCVNRELYLECDSTKKLRRDNKSETKPDSHKSNHNNVSAVVQKRARIGKSTTPLLPMPSDKSILKTHIEKFKKIRMNVYSDSVKPIRSHDLPQCNCEPDYECRDNCDNRILYIECDPKSCPSGNSCQNIKIQKQIVVPVERFMTENRGWGVKTKHHIEKGTYIMEYVGEIVDERKFKERMDTDYKGNKHDYCLQLDKNLIIDAYRMGNDCRFVNHSCEPNCEMQKWSVNGLSRMALFALRDIQPEEELTFDYKFLPFNPNSVQVCKCGSENCLGHIGAKFQCVKPAGIKVRIYYMKLKIYLGVWML